MVPISHVSVRANEDVGSAADSQALEGGAIDVHERSRRIAEVERGEPSGEEEPWVPASQVCKLGLVPSRCGPTEQKVEGAPGDEGVQPSDLPVDVDPDVRQPFTRSGTW